MPAKWHAPSFSYAAFALFAPDFDAHFAQFCLGIEEERPYRTLAGCYPFHFHRFFFAFATPLGILRSWERPQPGQQLRRRQLVNVQYSIFTVGLIGGLNWNSLR